MADDLEARLRSHAKAFDGLMSLIPAQDYYAQDNSEQYRKKKQTKEQKKEARKAKLKPESIKSAKDVMDEMDRKRKREIEGDDVSDVEGVSKEQPREGLKPSAKKQKKDKPADKPEKKEKDPDAEDKARKKKAAQDQKRKEKAQRRKEADARFAAKHGTQTKSDTDAPAAPPASKALPNGIKPKPAKVAKTKAQNAPIENSEDDVEQEAESSGDEEDGEVEQTAELNVKDDNVPHSGDESSEDSEDEEDDEQSDQEESDEDQDAEVAKLDLAGLADADATSTATPSPAPESPASAIPSTSSSSSIVPPTSAQDDDVSTKPSKPKSNPKPKLPAADKAALHERLTARIEALRAARKADGIDGKPARNRQELLEARRRKAEERKKHKKEMRKHAKDEEQKAAAEAELARLRGSGSPLTGSDIFSPRVEANNFSFGRVAFDDGMEFDSNLSSLREHGKKKGSNDTKASLLAAEKRAARLNGLDETKRKELEEKDLWLAAKKKAHGEKVRDDTSLLKKALKRKEKQKGKSEKEWTDRIEGVAKGKEIKQKKREENLRKRKEGTGSKGKKGKTGKPAGKKGKSRPGFEGSFKSKAK